MSENCVLSRQALHRIAYARRNRSSVVLVTLCFFILMTPLFGSSATGAVSLTVCLMAIMVLALWALRTRRMWFVAVVVFALVTVAALVADQAGEHALRPVALVASSVFMAGVTMAMLRYVLDSRPITTDKVFGAIAAYVLIAFSFASLFGLLELYRPGSFHSSIAGEDRLTWSAMMYFSFTVLTSTGFGEITPALPMARALIVLEQLLGVMYVAFLIARMANLWGHRPR